MSKATKNLSPPVPQPPQKPEEKPEPGIRTEACNAWGEVYDLTRGLEDLLFHALCSDNAVSSLGCGALYALAKGIVEQMSIVDRYFHQK